MKIRNTIRVISLFVFCGIFLPGFTFAAALVHLGAAENFAVLSKIGISTNGNSFIIGDVGVSPAPASALSGFGLTMDVSNEFSSSGSVEGKIYAANYTSSAGISKAIADMDAAYNDAVARNFPTSTGRAGGEIGGLAFTPGTYKWNTSVVIASDITLTGGAEDVWIFQVAEDLTVASGVKILLTDGAQAKNIFWQVAGRTVLESQALFVGNILSQNTVTFKNGATLSGRILSQEAIALNGGVITKPGLTRTTAQSVQGSASTTSVLLPQNTASSTPNSTPVNTLTTEQALQAQLDALRATLQSLVLQAKNAGMVLPSSLVPFVKSESRFVMDLSLGSKGEGVLALQKFLIEKKIGSDAEKLAQAGPTGFFGTLTQNAVKEFQKNVGIVPASGYFGPKTRGYLNALP